MVEIKEEIKEEVKEKTVMIVPEPKKKRTKDDILEIIIAVFLGITALATAWAGWIGSLHGGNMSTNYT